MATVLRDNLILFYGHLYAAALKVKPQVNDEDSAVKEEARRLLNHANDWIRLIRSNPNLSIVTRLQYFL